MDSLRWFFNAMPSLVESVHEIAPIPGHSHFCLDAPKQRRKGTMVILGDLELICSGISAGQVKSIGRIRGMVREHLAAELAEIDSLVEQILR